jgi:hypothetical protein
MTALRHFRVAALLEGWSYLMLRFEDDRDGNPPLALSFVSEWRRGL